MEFVTEKYTLLEHAVRGQILITRTFFAIAAILTAVAAAPAMAGTLSFAMKPCGGCGMDSLAGTIVGVGADRTYTPTDVVVTGYDVNAFLAAGWSTRPAPFSAASWTQPSVADWGPTAGTVTLSEGLVQDIDIFLAEPVAPFANFALYRENGIEVVSLQLDATMNLEPGFGIAGGFYPGYSTLVDYVYSDATAVPEPVSMSLLLVGALGGAAVRRKRHVG